MIFTGAEPRRRLTAPRLAVLVGAGCCVLIALQAAFLAPAVLAAALAAGALAVLAWRWPAWAAVAFAALVPVNRFLILGFLHLTGADSLSRVALLWRDVLIGLLLMRVLYEAAFTTSPKRLRFLDLMVGGFLALSLLYLVYPGQGLDDPFVRIEGWRTDASFLVAYFVGRGLRLQRRHLRWMLLVLVPGSVIVGLVGVWEFTNPIQANAVFTALGVQDFNQIKAGALGDQAAGAVTVRSRSIPGVNLARASSLLLGDLALAFYCVVLVSVAGALLFQARTLRGRLAAGVFLLAMLGTLAMTITRSAIVGAFPVLLILAIWSRALGRLVLVLASVAALAVAVIALTTIDLDVVNRLVTLQDASSLGHLDAFDRSLQVIRQYPLGQGLGTAGTIGQRFQTGASITNENWYLQVSTEMGIGLGALYLVIVVWAAVAALAAALHVRDQWLRVTALAVAGSMIGFLIVGNFLHAWENTVLSMLVWLMAGITINARGLDSDPAYAESP